MRAQAQFTITVVMDMDSVEIGGRNLLKETKAWTTDASRLKGWQWSSVFTKAIDEEGFTVVSASRSGLTSTNIASLFGSKSMCKKGDLVVCQLMVKVDSLANFDVTVPYIFEVYDATGTRVQYQDCNITVANGNKPTVVDGSWFLFYTTHTITADSADTMSMRVTLFKNGSISYKKPKMEFGNKRTDWSPAPEDTDNAIKDVDNKFASYSTTTEMNTAITQTKNSIISDVEASFASKASLTPLTTSIGNLDTALQDEINRAQAQESTLNGKFVDYVLTNTYNTKVSQLEQSWSAEVTARKVFETSIIGNNYCDEEPIDDNDVCDDDDDTLVSNMLKDTSAKLELLSDRFGVALQDNVNALNGSLTLATNKFATDISNLKTNTSTQIEQLENSIALKQNAGELSSSLSLENGTISLDGSRLNWTSTYSSMTNDGTLTCQNLVATNATLSGTFSNSGAYGSTTIANGYLLTSGSYQASNGSNTSTLQPSGLVVGTSGYTSNHGGGVSTIGNIEVNGISGVIYVGASRYPVLTSATGASSSHAHGTLYANSNPSSISAYYSSSANFVNTSTGNLGTNSNPWYTAYLNSAAVVTSDARKKHSIADIDDKLVRLILSVKPKTFKLNADKEEVTHTGLIAQELEELMQGFGLNEKSFGSLVKEPVYSKQLEDGEPDKNSEIIDYEYSIRYTELIAPLISAVQMLCKRVTELEERICQA